MLNEMIKEQRESLHMTRAELSDKTDISAIRLSNIERGLVAVTEANLKALLKVLKPKEQKKWAFYYMAQGSRFSKEVLAKLCALYMEK